MRLSLKGSLPQNRPRLFIFAADGTFDKTLFPEYTNFDAIVIGAGGGRGGGYYGEDSEHAGITLRSIGGEGGGGGYHRIQGVLEGLGDSIDIIVGTPGANGIDHSELDDLTDGEDGATSWFGDICYASGGNGGKKVESASIDFNMGANGGDGGLGGISEHGWGGMGGICGAVDDPEVVGDAPGTNGEDGPLLVGPYEYTIGFFTLRGTIGKGGGGGAGGLARLVDDEWVRHFPFPTSGGRGSYDLDERVFGPGTAPGIDSETGLVIVPGRGGGARATPLTNSWRPYGSSQQAGLVVVRLTVE